MENKKNNVSVNNVVEVLILIIMEDTHGVQTSLGTKKASMS